MLKPSGGRRGGGCSGYSERPERTCFAESPLKGTAQAFGSPATPEAGERG